MRTVILVGLLVAGGALAEAVVSAKGVSDGDKVRQTADGLKIMGQVLKDVLGKLEDARNSKDVLKLNCVNEKLTQVKGLLRISEQAYVALQEAIAKRESAVADHEYTKAGIAQQKVSQLRAEAEECIGQLAFQTDENQTVEVEIPDDLPAGDPSIMLPTLQVFAQPPPASSTL